MVVHDAFTRTVSWGQELCGIFGMVGRVRDRGWGC